MNNISMFTVQILMSAHRVFSSLIETHYVHGCMFFMAQHRGKSDTAIWLSLQIVCLKIHLLLLLCFRMECVKSVDFICWVASVSSLTKHFMMCVLNKKHLSALENWVISESMMPGCWCMTTKMLLHPSTFYSKCSVSLAFHLLCDD